VNIWTCELRYLKGVGEKLAAIFFKSDITTLWDLLLTLPRIYEDRRKYSKAKILSYHERRLGPRRSNLEALVQLDNHQNAVFTWFHNPGNSIQKRFPPQSEVVFFGEAQSYQGRLQYVHPELYLDVEGQRPWWEYGAFVPVYRELGGLSNRVLRKILAQAVGRDELTKLPEVLPLEILTKRELPSLSKSLRELHFPTEWMPSEHEFKPASQYLKRVAFEELFVMSLALHLRKAKWREEALRGEGQRIARIRALAAPTLPFKLTTAQEEALREIFEDMSGDIDAGPMHRLLQGDVGSGKTIVAFLSALAAINSGYQVALMVPTEILADQHAQNFAKLFPEMALSAGLLKGALTAKAKKDLRAQIESGELKLVIGTQALLTSDTHFKKLGLVIVDEQHRFGVEQRLLLKNQESEVFPHLLVMTATPIPRSLALTLYGDLSVSVLHEKPKGRQAIETHLLRQKSTNALKERIKKFVQDGRQVYVVYPLVEESEDLDLKNATLGFAEWSKTLGGVKAGLLHGRLKAAEKKAIMDAFKAGDIRLLVSTTVIEVGVDVPNASVMVIEHAERFGLSQLHQLRGRVGRGTEKSLCVLVGPDFMRPELEERLSILVQSDDGFKIAEKDLELRGPGEFLGRRQSGLPGFRVAHILRDVRLLEEAREDARDILARDPKLELPEHRLLLESLNHWWASRIDLTLSG
jgi:ATP-dependent DNA helicase RecG